MTFGQTLYKLRTSHNVTQAELSEYLKISKSLISMYERDKRKPSFEILEGIADFFNVDMNTLHGVNIDNQNRIHPFYMVYIGMDGEIICDYLNPKQLLDDIRLLCRGKKEPIVDLCQKFNEETNDGKDMQELSNLLRETIHSIIDTKEESDIDSLFTVGGTSALISVVSGLDDFELISFLVVK